MKQNVLRLESILCGSFVVGSVGRYKPEGFPTDFAYISGIKVEYNNGYFEI